MLPSFLFLAWIDDGKADDVLLDLAHADRGRSWLRDQITRLKRSKYANVSRALVRTVKSEECFVTQITLYIFMGWQDVWPICNLKTKRAYLISQLAHVLGRAAMRTASALSELYTVAPSCSPNSVLACNVLVIECLTCTLSAWFSALYTKCPCYVVLCMQSVLIT